jgi:hypothetical protein
MVGRKQPAVQSKGTNDTLPLRLPILSRIPGGMKNLISALAAPFIAFLLVSNLAAGQSTRISAHLALARICVSEANWDCFNTGDGLAIHEVLLRGAERHEMSYVAFARAYSGRVLGARPHDSDRLRWVAGLREDGRAPDAWPRFTFRPDGDVVQVLPGPSWSRYRDRWMQVLDRAREVVALDLSTSSEWSPCESAVHDWGGTMDRSRAERIGLIPVSCGDTRNDFYARPSLSEEEAD